MSECVMPIRGGGNDKEIKVTTSYRNSDGKSYFSMSFRPADITGARLCATVNFQYLTNVETCCIFATYPCTSTGYVVSALHRRGQTSINQFPPSSVTVEGEYVRIEFLYAYASNPIEFLDVAGIKIQ